MDHSTWRVRLAHQIAEHYPAAAILLVGSAATGQADPWSDLDIIMYWQVIPTEVERRAIAAKIGGHSIQTADSTDGDFALSSQDDAYRLGESQLKVDITHKTVAAVETLIADVVERHEMHTIKLAVLNGMTRGLPITGAALINHWYEQIGDLPRALVQPLLDQYLRQLTAYDLVMMIVRRGDVLFARELITGWCNALMIALLVANHVYPPMNGKHLISTTAHLSVKPADFAARVCQICELPITEAMPVARALIEETLVAIEASGYDVSAGRTRFQSTRPPNEMPIML